MLQLRITPKPDETGFYWQVVTLVKSDLGEVLAVGEHEDLDVSLIRGKEELERALAKPGGPVQHDWECGCGAQMHVEARPSKSNPYTWDRPREIMCNCGRIYGIKVSFATGVAQPKVEHVYIKIDTSHHPA
jgi:hypothetical protein